MSEDLYMEFLNMVAPYDQSYVNALHQYMITQGCKVEIKPAKSGYVVSYRLDKLVVANFVFRKGGVVFRLYGDGYSDYRDALESLPAAMKKEIERASACKRLINPDDCNSRCKMGYDFELDGNHHQKCRYNAFMFLITDESKPFIQSLAECEIEQRKQA